MPILSGLEKKPPKNGEDFGGQKINNMKHKLAAKIIKNLHTARHGGKTI